MFRVATLHKIAERVSEREQRRLDDKDALDVLRLLQATETSLLAATVVQLLQSDLSRDITREALAVLKDRFADPRRQPDVQIGALGDLNSYLEMVRGAVGRDGRVRAPHIRAGLDPRQLIVVSNTPVETNVIVLAAHDAVLAGRQVHGDPAVCDEPPFEGR